MTSHQRPPSGTAQSRPQAHAEPEPSPPEAEVRRVYQPVEIRCDDGNWAAGRINGWWRSPAGALWCRLRVPGSGTPARWVPFDASHLTLLQTEGT